MTITTIASLDDLAAICAAIIGPSAALSCAERAVVDGVRAEPTSLLVDQIQNEIVFGGDPLGDAFCAIQSPAERRPLGQTFTPPAIIASMIAWASEQESPGRIVDPGAGSGRYLLAAARQFPEAAVVALDVDPLASLMQRAVVATLGIGAQTTVICGDYRSLDLAPIEKPTMFIGNPPYVRHHQIEPDWKRWLLSTAKQHGLKASGLAGLHVHFFLATAEHGRAGDYGAFITSAEWMDVNYGSLVRALLLGDLGGQSLHVLDPETSVFADATTTGAISCFRIGDRPPSIKVRKVAKLSDLNDLSGGRRISRNRLAETSRWSTLVRVTPKLPEGFIELGDLCRVHRGAVTGANKVWVQQSDEGVLPASVLFPSVTKARDLFSAGERLKSEGELRSVVDLPIDLDVLDDDERKLVDRFLRSAKKKGVDKGYVAQNRRAWWSVGLRDPAPVLATYMARRPPAFVRNDVGARHINVVHGLYPRQELTPPVLDALSRHLSTATTLSQGRTYAGGLTKFEPREMERLPIPSLEMLSGGASLVDDRSTGLVRR